MKKYYSLSAASLSLSALAFLAGCQDYEGPDGSAEAQKQAYLKEQDAAYTAAFTKAFGEVDPKHTWGMDEPLQRMGWGASTRAAGNVDTRRNMWVDRDGDTGSYSSRPYKSDALAHDIIIPGWPNFDGRYYGNYGSSTLDKIWTDETLPNGAQPCGDVTDYEIQYVSAWFRTHPNPTPNIELHLSDFFIQNVSCDNDQLSYSNTLTGGTTAETGKNGENIISGDQNTSYIKRNNGSKEVINYSLDQLGFYSMDGDWTHVNNFNHQNSNQNPEESQTTNNREIKYITSSGTEDFRCHPSFSTSSETEWIKSYVLMRLEWMEPDQNGVMHHREGYYLAFDFQAKKSETEVACDGYYSNWIVKITPGNFAPTSVAKRIMCEDLGGTFDFDFNDVVVDVALDGSGNSIISVQAAGGTMPVYLDYPSTTDANQIDSRYEIHALLGASSTQPVNVLSDYTHQHAPAIFRGKTCLTKPADLPIRVENTKDNQTYNINGDRANLAQNTYGTPNDQNGNVAPRAFATETRVKWMKEMTFIDKSYPGFKYWVADENYKYNQSEGPALNWYEQSKPQADDNPTTSFVYWPGTIINTSGLPEGWKQETPANWQTLTPIADTFTHASVVGALGSIKVDGYTGNGSIIYNFKNNDAQTITLTVILKSDVNPVNPTYDEHGVLTNGSNLIQAVLIPADDLTDAEKTEHSGMTMEYKGNFFNRESIQSQDYRIATYQNYTGQDENSMMPDGYKDFTGLTNTYALKMTFNKSQLMHSTSPEKYVDYINFFIKVPEGKNAKIFNWHVHY